MKQQMELKIQKYLLVVLLMIIVNVIVVILKLNMHQLKKKQIIALIIDNNIDTAKIDEIQISGRENQTSVIGYLTSCIYINCSNNIDWPKENKDEIQKAINKCLEVYYIYLLKYLF